MQSSLIPNNLEILLSREGAAQALTAAGYVTSPSTLATKATRGNGPAYRIFGKRAIYRWGDLIAWAEANTAPLRNSHGGPTLLRVPVSSLEGMARFAEQMQAVGYPPIARCSTHATRRTKP